MNSDLVGWIRTAGLGVALITFMSTSHNSIRADIGAQIDSLRADIRADHAEMRSEHAGIREDIKVLIGRTVRNETRIDKLETQPEMNSE